MLTLEIEVSALRHNITYLVGRTKAEICAVVKANAYGHGIETARFIDDYVHSFAVASGDEALELRKYTDKPIYVLSPSEDIGDKNVIYSAMSERDLVHERVCVKINSGMNRLGVPPEQARAFLDLCAKRNVSVDSIYTHFSDVSYAPTQLERFTAIETDLKRHAAASNFLMLDPRFHLDMVRCGLALYGYFDGLKPVLSAYTEVYNVLRVKKGERIGYAFSAPRDMRIAVLGAGYADGIRRRAQNFFLGGRVCPSVGNVCMDMCFADIGELEVKAGDRAEILGKNMPAEAVARQNETIVYEILTSFPSRCKRIFVGE